MYINYYKNEGPDPLDSIQKLALKASTSKINPSYLRHNFKKYSNTTIWRPVQSDLINPILD